MESKSINSPWYYVLNGQRLGPIPYTELKKLVQEGVLQKSSLIWRPGLTNWMPAAEENELFFEEKIPPEIPQSLISAEISTENKIAYTDPSSSTLSMIKKTSLGAMESIDIQKRKQQAIDLYHLYRLFWTRVLKSDFNYITTTEQESKILESGIEPVKSPIAQTYASWRRSLLMICLLMLGITLFFNSIDLISVFSNSKKHPIMVFHAIFLFIIQILSFSLCMFSAFKWGNLRTSRTFVRFAWIVQFFGPFLLFVMPLSLFVNDKIILALLGFNSIKILAPKIFSLFPGLIRCSLTIKTLLPETSVSGWLAIVIAPIYALFLCVASITCLQTSNIFLGIGFGFISLGMSVVIIKSQELLKPITREESSEVVFRIKRIQSTFQGVGIFFIIIHVFRNFEINFGFLNNVMLFIFSFIGNVTLLTVVMSDFMLAMIRQGSIQAKEFENSPLSETYRDRLEQLASCGLTELEVGETKLAVELGSRGMGLAKLAASKSASFFQKPKN